MSKVTDMQYPKSLGEVCLELAQEQFRHDFYTAKRTWVIKDPSADVPVICQSYRTINPESLMNLRTALYHRSAS